MSVTGDHQQSTCLHSPDRGPLFLQLADSTHWASSRGDTDVEAVTSPSDGELHLPAIRSSSKRQFTDASNTASGGSSLFADDESSTRMSWSKGRCSRHISVDDLPSLSTAAASTTSTDTSAACIKCSRLLSTDVADDSAFSYGLERGVGDDGRGKSKELRDTVAASFDDVGQHGVSPRGVGEKRDRRRQIGVCVDDDGRLARNRLPRFNCTTSLNNKSQISAAVGATTGETTGGTRYSGNVADSRLHRRRPEPSTRDVNPIAATTNRKNRSSGQFLDHVEVLPVTSRPRLFKTPADPRPVRRPEPSVVRPINARPKVTIFSKKFSIVRIMFYINYFHSNQLMTIT